jgi:RNA polymerase sigma-70 factor, ECF subfamily
LRWPLSKIVSCISRSVALESSMPKEADLPLDKLAERYPRLAPLIYRRCLSILADKEEAMDATQDIYILLQQKMDTFREEAELTTWIYRIATNHCLNRLRAKKVRRRALDFLSQQRECFSPNKETISGSLERRTIIQELLQHFDSRRVQIVIHRYFHEMSHDEIAKVMGISDRAVRKALKTFETRAAELLKRLGHTAEEIP